MWPAAQSKGRATRRTTSKALDLRGTLAAACGRQSEVSSDCQIDRDACSRPVLTPPTRATILRVRGARDMRTSTRAGRTRALRASAHLDLGVTCQMVRTPTDFVRCHI